MQVPHIDKLVLVQVCPPGLLQGDQSTLLIVIPGESWRVRPGIQNR
jgi:hypothetical protein